MIVRYTVIGGTIAVQISEGMCVYGARGCECATRLAIAGMIDRYTVISGICDCCLSAGGDVCVWGRERHILVVYQ